MNNNDKYISFTSVNRTLDSALEIFKQRIKDALDVYSIFGDKFELRVCPVCGAKENKEIDKFHETYGIAKCTCCASVFVNPCPTLEALEYYYNTCSCNNMLGDVYRNRPLSDNLIISDRVLSVVDIVREVLDSRANKQPIKILEVGCNSGVFLSELKQALSIEKLSSSCTLQGVDIDKEAIQRSVDPDLDLIASPIEEFSKGNSAEFDLIIHFELIEHLHNPFQFMESINRLLKPSGIHHFDTPNINGMDNMALNWNSKRLLAHGIFPPMHLNAFTTQNITLFALRSGFNMVSLDTPGKLDVDIVRLMRDELPGNSPFSKINDFTEEQLSIIQGWLQLLNASSHMRVTLKKV